MNALDEYNRLRLIVANVLDSPSIGGNISVKDGNLIYIKASGTDLKKSDKVSIYDMNNNVVINNVKPSMELNFHLSLKKYVLHYHPIYINWFLLLNSGMLKTLFKDIIEKLNIDIIEYKTPGKELSSQISKDSSNIIFLLNHGVIIHSDDRDELIFLYTRLRSHFLAYMKLKQFHTLDEVVLKNDDEIMLTHWAMKGLMSYHLDTMKYNLLSNENILNLLNNKDELFRMTGE